MIQTVLPNSINRKTLFLLMLFG